MRRNTHNNREKRLKDFYPDMLKKQKQNKKQTKACGLWETVRHIWTREKLETVVLHSSVLFYIFNKTAFHTEHFHKFRRKELQQKYIFIVLIRQL